MTKKNVQLAFIGVGVFMFALVMVGVGVRVQANQKLAHIQSTDVQKSGQKNELANSLSATQTAFPGDAGANSTDTANQGLAATSTIPKAPSIIAQGSVIFDLKQGKVLYDKQSLVQLPLASLTKLMTALVAADTLGTSTTVTIQSRDLISGAGTGLTVGEQWAPQDLIDYMLVSSSNDAATALARAAGARMPKTDDNSDQFVLAMNQRAHSLGMLSTVYYNPTGLDENINTAGALGSARDIALLMTYLVENRPELLARTRLATATISSETQSHTVKNTNEAIPEIPGLIASKTGYTDLADGNLAIAFDRDINNPIVIVVLGSTFDGRFSDTINLTKWVRKLP